MSIRKRLTVHYAVLLTSLFMGVCLLTYLMARNALISPVDDELQATAEQFQNRTDIFVSGSMGPRIFPRPTSPFETNNLYIVAFSPDGQLLGHSTNLGQNPTPLDELNLTSTQSVYRTLVRNEVYIRVHTHVFYASRGGAGDENEQGVILGRVQVGQSIQAYQETLNLLLVGMALASLLVFTLVFLLGGWTTQAFLKPIEEITVLAGQISRAHDLGRRLPDRGQRDELGRLTLVLNQTFERLENLFRAQQRLLADVSHELRTPLTTMRGNIDLMRRMGEYDPESLDIIQDEIKRMTRLVGDLLLLARADGGSLPIMRHTIELDTLLFEVHRQTQPLQKSSGVKVDMREITPIQMLGDPDRLKQLVIILLDNAIKYTPRGGEVRLSLVQEAHEALIHVSDNGPGIPAEHLPHLFERFYRVDKSRTRAQGGAGLGLSIARWIAEAHGGRIAVTSLVGQGSTFTIHLPRLEETSS